MSAVSSPTLAASRAPLDIAQLALTLGLILWLIFLPWLWVSGFDVPSDLRHLTWLFLGAGAVLLYARGATDLSPATWVFVIAAYPLAAPLIALDLLGYAAYASGARHHQTLQALTVPVLIGSAACLLLVLHLSVARISVPRARPGASSRPALAARSALLVLMLSSALLVIACLLDAPMEVRQLGTVGYRDLKANRDDALNVASGLVFVFGAMATLALAQVLTHPDIGPKLRGLCGVGYAILSALVVFWQTMAASRIEVAGLLLLLYLCFADRLRPALRLGLAAGTILALGVIGYVRTLAGTLAYLSRDFMSWPGGVENVFNTFNQALNGLRHGAIPVQQGETYLWLLQRLPPSSLSLDRPPRAYDLVADYTHLIGGEYYLTEPFLNGLGIGVALCVLLILKATNATIGVLRTARQGAAHLGQSILAMVWIAVSFRVFWYGAEHALKIMILALVLSVPVAAVARRRLGGHHV
jgi:hypothetical protein